MVKSKYNAKRILVIGDLHVPAQHPDAIAFLRTLKKYIKPTLVVFIGDILDATALSFFEKNPSLPSAGDELKQSIKMLKEFYALFPKAVVVHGNHDLRPVRTAKKAGIPNEYLKNIPTVLNMPKGWEYKSELVVKLPTGEECMFRHQFKKNIKKSVADWGMCLVQGHYHTEMKIDFCPNHYNCNWGMNTGCLIWDHYPHFDYMNNSSGTKDGKSIIGSAAIVEGQPFLFPMRLKRGGRWNGTL